MPVPASVRIEPYKGGGYFLIYCDSHGKKMTDGWHKSVEEAKNQARVEFEILEDDWIGEKN
jgi:hypothetical protein